MQGYWWIITYEKEFKDNLNKLSQHGKHVVEDLLHYPPQCWVIAYFNSTCKSDMVDNNIFETFNPWIRDARDKLIISMLEKIRI